MKNRRSRQEREQFLEMLISLLENGFSLQESLAVMQRNQQFSQSIITSFRQGLTHGASFAQCLLAAGFSLQEMTQVQLADIHGNLLVTLKNILTSMKIIRKQKNDLGKVATYPALLLVFVISLLFAMRFFLLPSLLQSGMIDPHHWSIQLIRYGPFVLLGTIAVSLLFTLVVKQSLKRRSALQRAVALARFPLIGRLYILYQTSYFSLEWGKMFKQGLEIRQILAFMAEVESHSLVAGLAKELNDKLTAGKSLAAELESYPFLLPEFSLIVLQGEVKGKLGDELLLYSQLLIKKLVDKVERWIQWVQPVVFLFIAVLIMAIYIALFLPMYGNISTIME